MRILNIGLDKKIFEEGSNVRKRVLEYARFFERFDVLVLTKRRFNKVELDSVAIWPTNSRSRFFYLRDAYLLGGKMINKYGYNLISIQDPFEMGIVGWLLARKYNIKLQVQVHGDYFASYYWRREKFLNRFRYYLAKFMIGRADGIRVVSERVKKSLLEMRIDERKISVVPVYVEIQKEKLKFKSDREKLKTGDKFIFLTVGRLEPVKNIEMQIRAMAEVIKKHPETKLWIVGSGSEECKLKLEIGNWKLQNYVKLLGWRDDLAEFYQKADVFLLTSNFEGWGLVVIEAASYGLPIIMTDVGCAGEVIKNNKSGLIIPVGDGKKLEESICKLIEDEKLRQELGEKAKEAIKKLPSKSETLALYKKSWEKVLINI